MSDEDWLSDEERNDLEWSRRAVDEAERKRFDDEMLPWRRPNGEAKARRQKPKMVIEWFGEAANSALSDPANQLVEDVLDEGGLSVDYGDSGSEKPSPLSTRRSMWAPGSTGTEKRLDAGLSFTSRRKAASESSAGLQRSKSASVKIMATSRLTRFSPSSDIKSTFDLATLI